MPTYLYRCLMGHEEEKTHKIDECEKEHFCVQCNCPMTRVPQLTRHYYPPGKLLLDKLSEAYNDRKARNDKWRERKAMGKIIS